MERDLSPVPPPELQPSVDIIVYLDPDYAAIICMFGFLPAPHLTNAAGLVGTSLSGTRSAQDFIALLKMVIRPDDFHLQSLKDGHIVRVNTEGNISPGDYIVGTYILAYLQCSEYQHFLAQLVLVINMAPTPYIHSEESLI
jgi:hypothetical protein